MMRKIFTGPALALLLPLAGSLSAPALGDDLSARQRLDGAITQIGQDYPAGGPGLSYHVDLGDGLGITGAFGLADIEWAIPLDNKSLHRIGSVSKSVTAIAVLDLFTRRGLSLDAPVATFAPALPPHIGERSMRQLLSHTSGLAEHAFNEKLLPYIWRPMTTDKIIEIETETPPEFAPGSRYEYSNFNYVVVAHLLEQITGESFVAFINTYLRAHGIDGQYDETDKITPHRPEYYNEWNGDLTNTPAVDLSHVSAAGALILSLDGMREWGEKLIEGQLVDGDLLATAWTPTILPDGTKATYGLGFNIGHFCGEDVVWHTGATPGARAAYVLFPKLNKQVLLLSNVYRDRGLYRSIGTLLGAVYGLEDGADWAESTKDQCRFSPSEAVD